MPEPLNQPTPTSHSIKWKDLLQCSPEESQAGKVISLGDPYAFPSRDHEDTYTSPTIRLLATERTRPNSNSPGRERGYIRYIWWHAFHPDGCQRPGQVKSFLDIAPLPGSPLERLKGCRDIILHLNHAMGYLGLLMDQCKGAKEKMEEDIPSFKNEWDEADMEFDERRYEWRMVHDGEYGFDCEGRLSWVDEEGMGREERVRLKGDVGFWTVRLPTSIRGLRERRLGRKERG